MLSKSFQRFLRDESGGYTIWSLIWFSLYVAMGGLAVDVTDAYRNQTLLQSTADFSALAGVMSLPIKDDVEAQALNYAANNMTPAINGWVLKASDVTLGNWDSTTGKFIPGETAPDAVRVVTQRSDENLNPLATNFLRILGLWGLPFDRWNIRTEAVALRYIPNCVRDGFIARNQVDFNGNNSFFNEICIHGQNMDDDPGLNYAVDMGMGNEFESTVHVSMPDLDYMPTGDATCKNNPGLCSDSVLYAGDMWPTDVELLGAMFTAFESGGAYVPNYMFTADTITTDAVSRVLRYPIQRIRDADKADVEYKSGTIYVMTCTSPNKTINLPAGEGEMLSEIVIIADCNINAPSGLHLEDVVLASTYAGNGPNGLSQNAVKIAAGATLGGADFCASGRGVEIYSASSVMIGAGGEFHGLRIVAEYDVKFTAGNNDPVYDYGISVQAGHDIEFTSNNNFGLCPPDPDNVPGDYAWRYRLVR